MTFDVWFGEVVKEHYLHAKDFSDKEKFPLPCVYRWLRGACLPRPIQISLICKIVANKQYEVAPHKQPIAYDLIYNDICSQVMTVLEITKNHETAIRQ